VLVPSPRDVPSYDLEPEMSAAGVAEAVVSNLAAVTEPGVGFCVVNFANPDMVGHTGVIPAVVKGVEAADAALRRVVEATAARGGVCLVTADHGNAEIMLEPDGVSPHTAHTTSLVPLVLTADGAELRDGGTLADLAPTVLELLGLPVPEAMTGRSLVRDISNENR
jgi:2,3-bisphosphoglycerate-independent phosphoglycerate mutase